MQIPYLPLRGRKLPHFMGHIGPRMEICEISALPIPMVPRLQKCFALVGADTELTIPWPQTTPFHGGYRAQNGNMRNFGPTNPHGTALHQRNGYSKRKLRAWRVQKCIALVVSDSVITTAWKQSTPFHGGEYRAQNGNMRNFGPTNPLGTALVPKQWLYEKEATGMESPKMY